MFPRRSTSLAALVLLALVTAGCQGSPAVRRLANGESVDGINQPWSAPSHVGPPSVSPSASAKATSSASAAAATTPADKPSQAATPTSSDAPPQTTNEPTTAPTSNPAPTRTTQAPAPPPARQGDAPPAGEGGVDYPGVADLINKERKAAGLGLLARNTSLEPGARQCAQSNADASIKAGSLQLSHELAGCKYENLFGAEYTMSAQEIVQGWMDSPGHRQAMMDPKIKTIGIGYVNVGGYFMIAAAFDW